MFAVQWSQEMGVALEINLCTLMNQLFFKISSQFFVCFYKQLFELKHEYLKKNT